MKLMVSILNTDHVDQIYHILYNWFRCLDLAQSYDPSPYKLHRWQIEL